MKINRIQQIHDLLKQNHSISLNDLCDTFGVSKNTIRRDVAELEEQGVIRKVYGGIVLAEDEAGTPEPFANREGRNVEAKKKVAQIAASLVQDGDVIYIDSGTTTMHMIPYLAKRRYLTIVTASVHVINAASSYPGLNIIATGGTLYMPSNAFVGPSVLAALQNYNLSKVFLASTGISIAHGATNASPLECEIKRSLAQKNAARFLLVDSSKFDQASLMTYCDLKDLDAVITDKEPPKEYVDYFEKNNVRLITSPLGTLLPFTAGR